VNRGHIATCNPGGAGKWSFVKEHARDVLRGRDVVVVADNDDVGRKHAIDIAESLRDLRGPSFYAHHLLRRRT